jgi:hypothetical protein
MERGRASMKRICCPHADAVQHGVHSAAAAAVMEDGERASILH